MTYYLSFTPSAKEDLRLLKEAPNLQKRYKAVRKSLQFLITNSKHPSLRTHQYHSLRGPDGEKIFEAYAEQDTPAAYRIFFYYGSERGEIVISAITPHP
jgi:hypothetical protein